MNTFLSVPIGQGHTTFLYTFSGAYLAEKDFAMSYKHLFKDPKMPLQFTQVASLIALQK